MRGHDYNVPVYVCVCVCVWCVGVRVCMCACVCVSYPDQIASLKLQTSKSFNSCPKHNPLISLQLVVPQGWCVSKTWKP